MLLSVTCYVFVKMPLYMSDNPHDCDAMLHESLDVVDILKG